MKIYTKTGDGGETGLFGGQRVSKDCPRICAYGDVDELNAVLGLCRAENDDPSLEKILHKIQKELFVLGADLSAPYGNRSPKLRRISAANVRALEKTIDLLEVKLPPLKNFILPVGTDGACFLHLARTVCRRAERSVAALLNDSVKLVEGEIVGHEIKVSGKINPEILVYLNRLGDLLFVMARFANKSEKISEEKWEG